VVTDDRIAEALQNTRIHQESAVHALEVADAGHWCLAALVNVDAPRLLAALDAVLALPEKWDEIDDGPVSALTEDRGWVRAACARDLRKAVTRALLGEEAGS